MRFRFKFLLPVAALLSGALPISFAQKAAAGDEIIIAVAGPMSGDLARFGEQMRQGAQQAVTDINGHGGLLGRPVRLLVEDDGCDPHRAASVAGDAADNGAVFVAGHFCSGSSIAASEIYHDRGVLQISPASSDPQLTDAAAEAGWDNVFRVYGRDDSQAEFAGSWIAAKLKRRPTAVVTDGTRYSELVARVATDAMKQAGMQPVLEDSIAPGLPDYSQLMIELKEKKIRVLYFTGQSPEAAVIARQLRARHLRILLLGSGALNGNEFLAAADFAADGVMFTAEADAALFTAAHYLVSAFQARGVTPTDCTIRTYAAVSLWAAAAARAGTTEADKVAAALRAVGWTSVLGTLAFDAKGDPVTPDYAVYVVTNSKIGELPK